MSEILNTLAPFIPLAVTTMEHLIIPLFLGKGSIQKRRAEKILNILKPEIKKTLEELCTSENISEENAVKLFNCRNLLNDSFLDLEAENPLKKQLLNEEIRKILNEESYKYVYNKISEKDLSTLNLIGDSWMKLKQEFKNIEILPFFPIYSLLDSEKISFDNPEKRSNGVFTMTYHLNKLKYNGEESEILSKYNKHVDSIFNLINLGIVIYDTNDETIVGTTNSTIFSNLKPYSLALTNKGTFLYKIIKDIK